jgi:hypothetical protein
VPWLRGWVSVLVVGVRGGGGVGTLAASSAPLAPQSSVPRCGAWRAAAARGHHAVAAAVQTWCAILAAVPKSRLILKNKPFACPETRGLWLRRFTARGISRWRVELLPLTAGTAEHMAQYSLMDISLGPWPYAGAHAAAPGALQHVDTLAWSLTDVFLDHGPCTRCGYR